MKESRIKIEVFVVRQFFGDCNDTSYIGAYTDFWKAAKASIDTIQEEGSDEWIVHKDMDESTVWIQDGECYYSIDRLELE